MDTVKFTFFYQGTQLDDTSVDPPSNADDANAMRDITNGSGSEVADTLKTSIVVDGEDDMNIPDPFPFPPHYQPDIELGLKLQVLQPNQVAKFITRIANVMFLYKRYPRRSEYERVAQQVVKKYSFLESPVHPYVSLPMRNLKLLCVCISNLLCPFSFRVI